MTEPVELTGPEASLAPEAVRPPPGNPRFPLVDGLRALAALGVLVAHVSFVSGVARRGGPGWVLGDLDIGVTLFFVISGFLLYRPFVASDLSGKSIATLAYFRRRALRIFPAYWVALTLLAIYPGLLGVFTDNWWRYYLLLQNYSSDPGLRLGGLNQAWSLSIEVSFYIVLPAYALFARRFLGGSDPAVRLVRDLLVLAALGVASLAFRAWLIGSGNGVWLPILPAYFAWFAAGMAFAVVSVLAPMVPRAGAVSEFLARNSRAATVLAVGGYLALALTVPHDTDGFRLGGRADIAFFVGSAIVAALVLSVAVFPRRSGEELGVQRWLGGTTIAWLGLVSYGIFLWHQGVLSALFFDSSIRSLVSPWLRLVAYGLITLAVTIPIAAASYYVVERPLLRFKESRRRAG